MALLKENLAQLSQTGSRMNFSLPQHKAKCPFVLFIECKHIDCIPNYKPPNSINLVLLYYIVVIMAFDTAIKLAIRSFSLPYEGE